MDLEPTSPSGHAAAAPWSRREFRAARGVRLVADAYGATSALPVLLLHGGGQTRHAWRGTAQVLAEAGFYAVSVDLRGHGESDWCEDGNYELDFFADDIRAIAQQLSSAPALVGASLGGLAALICQYRYALARAVVLVDITPRMEPDGVQRIVGFMRAFPEGFASIDDAAEVVAAYLPHRPRPSDTSGLAKNLRLGEDGRWRWHWDPRFLSDKPRASRPDYPERINEAARSLEVPTMLVRGRMSEIVSEEGVREFLALVPHAEFVDVEDAAHMVAGDKNDAFCQAVVDFLRRRCPARI